RAAAPGLDEQEAARIRNLEPARRQAVSAGTSRGRDRRQDAWRRRWRLLPAAHPLRPEASGGRRARAAWRAGGALPVRASWARDLVIAPFRKARASGTLTCASLSSVRSIPGAEASPNTWDSWGKRWRA